MTPKLMKIAAMAQHCLQCCSLGLFRLVWRCSCRFCLLLCPCCCGTCSSTSVSVSSEAPASLHANWNHWMELGICRQRSITMTNHTADKTLLCSCSFSHMNSSMAQLPSAGWAEIWCGVRRVGSKLAGAFW